MRHSAPLWLVMESLLDALHFWTARALRRFGFVAESLNRNRVIFGRTI